MIVEKHEEIPRMSSMIQSNSSTFDGNTIVRAFLPMKDNDSLSKSIEES
jgi:hypothetical protein